MTGTQTLANKHYLSRNTAYYPITLLVLEKLGGTNIYTSADHMPCLHEPWLSVLGASSDLSVQA